MRISQNFEDSIKPKTHIDDTTSFNTSINDRDSYLGTTAKHGTQSHLSKPYTRKSQDKFSGGLSRLDVRDDLTSNFKNSTFDREMTMTSASKSQMQTKKISPKPSPRSNKKNQPKVRPMTAVTTTTKSSKLENEEDQKEEFHKSLIKTIDHNLKGEGLRKRKLQL